MPASPREATALPFQPLPFQRPLGARPLDDRRTEFRVWAPRAVKGVTLALGDRKPELLAMEDVGYGVFELITAAPAGSDYRFVMGGRRYPDPMSRSQPRGITGPSRVVGAADLGFSGSTPGFRAAPLARQVIYELHVGTFSTEGTFTGAIPHLPGLADLGITAVEVMPIAEFPGTRGWGYDGVYICAAQSSYGGPEGFAQFVAAAHEAGLAVILDAVYNHVGPGSDALEPFGPYFTDRYHTPWGSAINYDDADCDGVREWACQSAEGWVRDFGVDGLRLDAVHAIFDEGPEHLVAELTRRVRAINPRALVIAESPLNDPKVMRTPARGGWGCDAAWADDFHHCLRTLLTGEHEGYYADFGRVADLAKALGRPYVFDGEWSQVRRKRVGAPAPDLPRRAFVVCDQNHDQVGNRAFGDRLDPEVQPLAAMLTLLSGFTPMLFMGEEYGEPAPFQYFVDHIDPEIAEATRQGRRAEFAAFASFGHEIPDPMAVETFEASKLTREANPQIAQLYRRLLALRRRLPGGDPDAVDFSEAEGWLRLRRGAFELVANLSGSARALGARGMTLELASGPTVTLARGRLSLPPRSGALLIRKDQSP
ncbi:MAG TPA: malto-oligosyltrehalose trehalohydrolase [Solirubrobacteraceae bacterium]|nr:malto-oligosyltrehalose trehalohydrolase [Solirubrobacteraceae bacterium]